MIGPVHFQIAGVILVSLAIGHAWIPRRLEWHRQAAGMSLLNRQILHVHLFFIALVVFMNGLLFVGWPHLLLRSEPLSKVVLTGIGVFWSIRLGFQLFVFDHRLWRGDGLRTAIHLASILLWLYLAGICFAAVLGGQ